MNPPVFPKMPSGRTYRNGLWLAGVVSIFLTNCGPSVIAPPSGTGGMGGAGGPNGGGGTGGALPACAVAQDCPGIDSACKKRTCNEGVCGFAFEPTATPTPNQTSSDCKIRICNQYGQEIEIFDELDPFDDGNPCSDDTCTVDGPVNTPSAMGTPCMVGNGKKCDGKTQCVECIDGADCGSGVCSQSICAAPTCGDTTKNGTETDTDCGGADCVPCKDGFGCMVDTDCESQVCNALICAAPTCTDGKQNGTETDVNCGGTCPPCKAFQGCKLNADCKGGSCSGTTCLPTCTDSEKNASETDVDCGGGTCPGCGNGLACMQHTDCASTVCDGNNGCVASICGDCRITGGETCDDCNTIPGDGCSSMCAPELGYSCSGVPSVCVYTCGDGNVTAGEGCDDNNLNNGDGCSQACVVEMGYACQGMPSVCNPVCGDGINIGEACDDGNMNPGDGCSWPGCTVETGYTCTGTPSICDGICGDNLQRGTEQCDDGNTVAGDCCSATCTIEASCEVEPNNAANSANSLFPLTTPMRARIMPTGDNDYFSFTVSKPSDIRIETFQGYSGRACSSTPNVSDTYINLLAANGSTILAFNDNGGTNCSIIDPFFDTGARGLVGTFFVQVNETGTNAQISAYNLAVTVVGECSNGIIDGLDQCDDGNLIAGDGCDQNCKLEATPEIEPNTCLNAQGPFTLQSSSPMKFLSGNINPIGDEDWYRFSIPKTADLMFETFDAQGPGTCDVIETEIQLFTDDCVIQVTPTKTFGDLGLCAKLDAFNDVEVRHLPAGAYRLRVNETNNSNTIAYTLKASITAICGNGSVEGFEECDGGAGCTPTCDRIQVCGDGFYDAPEACDDGNLMNGDGCTSTCTVESGYNCGYYGKSCVPICGNGVKTGSEQCDDNNRAVGDGCDSSCTTETTAAEIEPNGTRAQVDAQPLLINGVSTTISGSVGMVGDKDIFRLVVASPQVIRIETFDGSGVTCNGITTTLRVFDDDPPMTQLALDSSRGTGNCGAYVAQFQPGTYYVQVEETGNNATIGAYKLSVRIQTDKGVEIESNDPYVRATPLIGSDVFVLGGHLAQGDSDFYAITVPASLRAIRAEIIEGSLMETCESGGINSHLTLYGPTGNYLGEDDDSGRGGRCSLIDGTGGAFAKDGFAQNLSPGTHYLQVRASLNPIVQTSPEGQFDYRLAVTIR